MSEDSDEEIQRLIEIRDRVEFRRLAGSLEREAWIMAARTVLEPGDREPCCVCGQFQGISQAHHVVPLTAQYDRGFKYPDQAYVWLCPNHHAMAHLFIQDDNRSMAPSAMRARGRTTGALHPDLSDKEFAKLVELMRSALRGPE